MSNLDIPRIASTENSDVEAEIVETYNDSDAKYTRPHSTSSSKVNGPTNIQPRNTLTGMPFRPEPDNITALSPLFPAQSNGQVAQLTPYDEGMGDGTSQFPTKGGVWEAIRNYGRKKRIPNESCGVHDMV
jgi:hypothetical protein